MTQAGTRAAAGCRRRPDRGTLAAVTHRRTRTFISGLLVAVFIGGTAMPVAAQNSDDFDSRVRNADGRLRGYEQRDIVLEGGDTPVLPYFVLVALTGLAAGVMFKNSRRTHLD